MHAGHAASSLFRSLRLAVLALAFVANGLAGAQTQRVDRGTTMQTVTSRDGTRIAYDTWGKGPPLIVVNGALSERSGNAELAQRLAGYLTVYSYDRRGRGDSVDTKPYSIQREIEDIEALIDRAGGSAFVYGKSSGASLALQAAAALGGKVKKLALYEPPYSEAEGAAREWKEFRVKIDELLAADRRADAVTLFMKFVGAPDDVVAKMQASPAWPGMVAMAPTLAYDNAVLGDDRSVPVQMAATVAAITLVMDGGASSGPMPFMRPTADKLAKAIPGAQRRVVEGQTHDVSPAVLAPILLEFFNQLVRGLAACGSARGLPYSSVGATDAAQENGMADDRTQRSGQDRSRINVKQDYEVRDWAKKFGVSPDELKKAVQAVGDRADQVEAHLKGSRPNAR